MTQKKRALVLHIGRHKTGTSSLQRFLIHNRLVLSKHGMHIPDIGLSGFAHHQLSIPLSRAMIRMNNESPEEIAIIADFNRRLAGQNYHSQVLISSEAFQNCAPKIVARAFKEFDARIVVYIRNHLDYLTSSYAQKVHATNYAGSLKDYYDNIWRLNYWQFLRDWEKSFPHHFVVRRYQRELLNNGDVVEDFLVHGLGLDGAAGFESPPVGDANPSLNSKVLQFKLHLNRSNVLDQARQGRAYRILPGLNSVFPANKFAITDDRLIQSIIVKNAESDRCCAEKYFGQQSLFSYDNYQPGSGDELTGRELDDMMSAFNELMRT